MKRNILSNKFNNYHRDTAAFTKTENEKADLKKAKSEYKKCERLSPEEKLQTLTIKD